MRTLKTTPILTLISLLISFLASVNCLLSATSQSMSIEWIQPDSIVVDGVVQEIMDNLYIPENMAHLQNGAVVRVVGRNNRWNARTAINGSKEPGSMGYNAENFRPGEGLEIEFARPITPQKVILYGANVLTGHLELEREDGEWEQIATIHHTEEVWQHEIQFSGFPTRKLRLIAESVAYTTHNSIRIIEVEVYE